MTGDLLAFVAQGSKRFGKNGLDAVVYPKPLQDRKDDGQQGCNRKQRFESQRHGLELDEILNEISSNQKSDFEERTEQPFNPSEIGRFSLPKRVEHPAPKSSDRL